MDSLRIALLIIGAVIVLLIYLTARKKSAAEVRNSAAEPRIEPDFSDLEDVEPESAIIKVTPAISESVDHLTQSEGTDEINTISEQPDLVGDAPAEDTKKPDVPEKVISLRIVRKGSGEFPAEDVILALRKSGLTHGRFGIFHLLASEDSDDALFSVASLTEPGSFDLQKLREHTLAGLSLFMLRPGPGRGVDAFDKMIEIARAVSITLQGELLDGDGSTLSIQRERFLREDLIQYELKHLQLK